MKRLSSIWSTDHETELRNYFSGEHIGRAGLQSKFGQQLARARDGLGEMQPDPQDVPPELFGADRRAEEVSAALVRIADLSVVLRGQYEEEPDGALEGFECFIEEGAERVCKADWAKDKFRLRGDGERARPMVVAIATLLEPPWSRTAEPVTRIIDSLPFARSEGPPIRVRRALRVLCRVASGFGVAGEKKPERGARDSARDALSCLASKALRLLDRAQRAYAKARAGAAADDIREFLRELDGAA